MDPARSIPVLASLDLAESEAFYTRILNCNLVYRDDSTLIVRRGEIEFHFWLTDDPRFPESTSCYIRGGEVENLFVEYSAAEVPGLTEFETRPWNMKEFYIRDPHGNLLRFGMAPEEVRSKPG